MCWDASCRNLQCFRSQCRENGYVWDAASVMNAPMLLWCGMNEVTIAEVRAIVSLESVSSNCESDIWHLKVAQAGECGSAQLRE